MKLLEIRGLEVRYGGIRAVKGIDLEIAAGELVCLIGANGAGKSSTLRAVSGLAQTAPGSIRFGGRDLAGVPAFARARAGLVMVPEGRGVFAQLSVEENLAMGAYARADAGIATDRARVFELFPRLAERRRQTAGTLSGGEQQMLAIGRALMSRPKLLALDEPSMGLAPIAAEKSKRACAGAPRLRHGERGDHALGRGACTARRPAGARSLSRRGGGVACAKAPCRRR